VDRLRRRPLMIAADLLRALLLVSVPAAALWGVLRIEQLYLIAFLTGSLTILFDVAYQSYLPTLVRREELVEGNSKLTASASVAEFGAFSLGGWLVQLLTAPFAILIDALSFLVSAAGIALIRAPEPPPLPHEQRGALRSEIAEGLHAVARDPILRPLALSTMTEALARGMIGAVILLYLSRGLGFNPGVLGIIFGIGGVSSLIGALFAERITARAGLGRTLMLSLVVMGAGTMLVPLAGDASWLAVAFLVANQLITDPAATVNDIAGVSLRQAVTPERMLGRVTAAIRFAALLLTLVAMLGSGLLAESIGLRSVLVLGASLSAVGALWLFLSPVRRLKGLPG
jgi:MFS family permease